LKAHLPQQGLCEWMPAAVPYTGLAGTVALRLHFLSAPFHTCTARPHLGHSCQPLKQVFPHYLLALTRQAHLPTVLSISTAPPGFGWSLVAAAFTCTARHAAALLLARHQQWQARWQYLNRAGAPVPGLWSHAYAASLAGPGSSPAIGIACQLAGCIEKTVLSVINRCFAQLQPHGYARVLVSEDALSSNHIILGARLLVTV